MFTTTEEPIDTTLYSKRQHEFFLTNDYFPERTQLNAG